MKEKGIKRAKSIFMFRGNQQSRVGEVSAALSSRPINIQTLQRHKPAPPLPSPDPCLSRVKEFVFKDGSLRLQLMDPLSLGLAAE